MPQGIQEEEEPTQGKVDKGLQEVSWQGVGSRPQLWVRKEKVEFTQINSSPHFPQNTDFPAFEDVLHFFRNVFLISKLPRNVPVKYDRELWQNSINAMQRVEEIKNKRQAHHIFQRMKMAKKIQKAKDSKEVERDLALIKSPAAGLRQAMKAKQHEEEEEGEVKMSELDTSLNLAANKKKVKARQEAKVEEVHEDKLEEMMEEAN